MQWRLWTAWILNQPTRCSRNLSSKGLFAFAVNAARPRGTHQPRTGNVHAKEPENRLRDPKNYIRLWTSRRPTDLLNRPRGRLLHPYSPFSTANCVGYGPVVGAGINPKCLTALSENRWCWLDSTNFIIRPVVFYNDPYYVRKPKTFR